VGPIAAIKTNHNKWSCKPTHKVDSSGSALHLQGMYRPSFVFTPETRWIQSVHFVSPSFTFGVPTWFIQIRYHHDIANAGTPQVETLNVFVAREGYKIVRIAMNLYASNKAGGTTSHYRFGERFSHYGEPLSIKLPCK
jgi:hypothetical protein